MRVADKKTARENPKVVEAVEAAAKALGDSGRILVRESRNRAADPCYGGG